MKYVGGRIGDFAMQALSSTLLPELVIREVYFGAQTKQRVSNNSSGLEHTGVEALLTPWKIIHPPSKSNDLKKVSAAEACSC
jgi:hypothetical protein